MADLADLRRDDSGTGVLVGTAASTVTAGRASVTIGGATVTAAVLRGVTLAIGDPILIARQGAAWWVLGALGVATPTNGTTGSQPSPDVPTGPTSGTLVCPPVETRSWRGSAWRTDTDEVVQGDYGGWGINTGCAFYGSLPRSLAGATVTAARLHLRRVTGGTYAAQQLTIRLMAEATRPAGAPGLGSSAAGPSLAVGAEGVYAAPTAMAQALADGTAGGLAVYVAGGTPYIRTAGRSEWGPAWTLTIDWRR